MTGTCPSIDTVTLIMIHNEVRTDRSVSAASPARRSTSETVREARDQHSPEDRRSLREGTRSYALSTLPDNIVPPKSRCTSAEGRHQGCTCPPSISETIISTCFSNTTVTLTFSSHSSLLTASRRKFFFSSS